jgi:glycosyltransferase involved in cell wall biosynthesis
MGKISCSDLQVYLPTFNRPELLRKTISSVLAQTVPVEHLCVLDNGGFAETREMLMEFEGSGVEYRDTREFGLWGNLIAAQKFLESKYVLLLHDDDLIHPEYLNVVLQVMDKHTSVNLLTANVAPWDIDQAPVDLPPLSQTGHLFSVSEYATYAYNAGHPSYSLAVYKRDAFKTLNISANFDRYGKWGDVPLMLESIKNGKAAVLTDACGWMGIHPEQDSNNQSTLPSYQAWINREANFLNYMGDNPLTLSGFSFCIMNFRHLRSGYKRRVSKDISFKQFTAEAYNASALTKKGRWARWISFGLVQKMLEHCLKIYYLKRSKPLL